MPTYHSIHFGCRANQADTAAVERDLSQRGFQAAAQPDAADVVVVNSCTVTAAADSELRQTVRRIHRENPNARILVTGCYAQRRPEELAAMAGVEWVVGNSHKSEIARLLSNSCSSTERQRGAKSFVPLRSLLSSESLSMDSDLRRLGSIVPAADVAPPSCAPTVLVGDIAAQRQFVAAPFFGGTVEDRTRPNLKIQDGCNNRCSFCIIPSVRGLSRSLPVADVLAQIRALVAAGYREVVLSGVNLGQYGRDLAGKTRFVPLLQTLLDATAVERLRLSSVEPMDFTDRLLDLMASTPRIARHVHAPLQSGSDRILRRMHRKYRAAQYRERMLAAYQRMPEAAFGADVMVGFPGEMNEDFEATRRLIEELPLTYLHVFPFSRRPGTPADRMKAQVNGVVSRERSRILRELASEKNLRFRERHLGRTLRLLTLSETASDGTLALTDNYIKVFISGAPLPVNQWIRTRILSVADGCLTGAGVDLEEELHRLEADSPSMMTCASA